MSTEFKKESMINISAGTDSNDEEIRVGDMIEVIKGFDKNDSGIIQELYLRDGRELLVFLSDMSGEEIDAFGDEVVKVVAKELSIKTESSLEKKGFTETLYDYYLRGYDNAIQFGYIPDMDKEQADAYTKGYKDGKAGTKKDINEFEKLSIRKKISFNPVEHEAVVWDKYANEFRNELMKLGYDADYTGQDEDNIIFSLVSTDTLKPVGDGSVNKERLLNANPVLDVPYLAKEVVYDVATLNKRAVDESALPKLYQAVSHYTEILTENNAGKKIKYKIDIPVGVTVEVTSRDEKEVDIKKDIDYLGKVYYAAGSEQDEEGRRTINWEEAVDPIDEWTINTNRFDEFFKPYTEEVVEKESSLEKLSYIRKTKDKEEWCVFSEKGKNMGCYDSKSGAEKRLKDIHYFKSKGKKKVKMYGEVPRGKIIRPSEGYTDKSYELFGETGRNQLGYDSKIEQHPPDWDDKSAKKKEIKKLKKEMDTLPNPLRDQLDYGMPVESKLEKVAEISDELESKLPVYVRKYDGNIGVQFKGQRSDAETDDIGGAIIEELDKTGYDVADTTFFYIEDNERWFNDVGTNEQLVVSLAKVEKIAISMDIVGAITNSEEGIEQYTVELLDKTLSEEGIEQYIDSIKVILEESGYAVINYEPEHEDDPYTLRFTIQEKKEDKKKTAVGTDERVRFVGEDISDTEFKDIVYNKLKDRVLYWDHMPGYILEFDVLVSDTSVVWHILKELGLEDKFHLEGASYRIEGLRKKAGNITTYKHLFKPYIADETTESIVVYTEKGSPLNKTIGIFNTWQELEEKTDTKKEDWQKKSNLETLLLDPPTSENGGLKRSSVLIHRSRWQDIINWTSTPSVTVTKKASAGSFTEEQMHEIANWAANFVYSGPYSLDVWLETYDKESLFSPEERAYVEKNIKWQIFDTIASSGRGGLNFDYKVVGNVIVPKTMDNSYAKVLNRIVSNNYKTSDIPQEYLDENGEVKEEDYSVIDEYFQLELDDAVDLYKIDFEPTLIGSIFGYDFYKGSSGDFYMDDPWAKESVKKEALYIEAGEEFDTVLRNVILADMVTEMIKDGNEITFIGTPVISLFVSGKGDNVLILDDGKVRKVLNEQEIDALVSENYLNKELDEMLKEGSKL